MGGNGLQDTKVVVGGNQSLNNQELEAKGFFSLNGNSYLQIDTSNFNQSLFTILGVAYNNIELDSQPKWAVVGLTQDFSNSFIRYGSLGLYSMDGISWSSIQDSSFFDINLSNNGYAWKKIASDNSNTWVSIGDQSTGSFIPNRKSASISTNSITTTNSWQDISIVDSNELQSYLYDIDYFNDTWVCVGNRKPTSTTPNVGGLWISSTSDPTDGWNTNEDISYEKYLYRGLSHDNSGRFLIVGHISINPLTGKALFSQPNTDISLINSSWTDISDNNVNSPNTNWYDTAYSSTKHKWVIVGNDSSGGKIVYNDDSSLNSWSVSDIKTDIDLSGLIFIRAVSWSNSLDKFIAIGETINRGIILSSSNGINWTKTGSSYDDLSGLKLLSIDSD